MRRLMQLADVDTADRLCDCLDEAGIGNEITMEFGSSFVATTVYVVWVDGGVDEAGVRAVVAGFDFDEVRPSRAFHERSSPCRKCRYELRGQTQSGRCPECGHPYALITLCVCARCGEEYFSDSAGCWRCEAAVGDR